MSDTYEYFDIDYNGYIYHFQKDINESYDTFYSRSWYIAKKEPRNIDEYKRLIDLSYIWRNKNLYNMVYDENITNKI